MPGADSREFKTFRVWNVHHPPCRKMALEGAGRLLLDLSPGAFGDRGEFPMEIIHFMPLFLENQYRVTHRLGRSAIEPCPSPPALSGSECQSMETHSPAQHCRERSRTARRTACR